MRTRQPGFSLIELMIAMTLGLLAVLAVGSVFIYGSRSYKQDTKLSSMQDELRFAMAQIAQDIEMAGFYAQIRSPVNDIDKHSSATVSNDCGPSPGLGLTWTYDERRAAVFTLGDASAADANAAFPCIASDEFVAGTDIIAIKRLGGSPIVESTSSNDDHSNHIHVRTNGLQTTVYVYTGTPPPPTGTNVEVYEFKPVVWYINRYAVSDQNPPIPSLCRKTLNPYGTTPRWERECLAQGIEDMQLEFGYDGSPADNVPDYFAEYTTMPGIATLERIVAVRVHLLVRSTETAVDYKNEKTYQLASVARGPFNDAYYRKTMSSVFLLRNPAHMLTPFALPQ